MMTTRTMAVEDSNDTALVTQSVAGDRDAFGRIVARHQSLICSLAYSSTGSLSKSEDIAQETFVTAWKHLGELREPAKLRAWLCGIARNIIGKALRRDSREPVHAAATLEEAGERPSLEPLPFEHAINKEEEALLWRSLQQVPETYREPLILFYREHRSVGRVADDLGLTEDAVKQRLSRGRKLLQEQVLLFVEGALEQSAPGQAFTAAVVASLPALTASTKAAAMAATAAKGGAMAKSAGLAGLCNVVFAPVFMFSSLYFSYRLERDDAKTPQRREFVTRYFRVLLLCVVVFFVAMYLLGIYGRVLFKSHPLLSIGLFVGVGLAYLIVIAALFLWMRKNLRVIRRTEAPESRPVPAFEYRSRGNLFGLPLVHIRLRGGMEAGPVKAWIAGGDLAVGALFAFGGVAIAPFSVGGCALGLLTIGGLAVGMVSFGGFSFGPWTAGGFAVGWEAAGGCVFAWQAALGGLAVAHDFASGAMALATHANDAAAEGFISASRFFRGWQVAIRYMAWLNLFWLIPLVMWRISRRPGRR